LGYKPQSNEHYNIGFNYQVGNKWPLKAWPHSYWKELETRIGDKYTLSWQQGLENIEDYFEWINSCELVVTNDSFGMHVAIALKKKIICLFGPTNYRENYLYGLGVSLFSEHFNCYEFPCRLAKCVNFEDTCMQLISPDVVYDAIDRVHSGELVQK